MKYHSSKKILKKYSHDRSIYEIEPSFVVFPKNEEDIVLLTNFARKNELSMISRGGGTGLSGAAIGKGIVIDFSKHLTKVHSIGKTTRVQSGILLKTLRPKVERKGYMLPSVPLHGDCAIGGNVNTRSIGPRTRKYGSIDSQVISLRGVLADGRVLDTAKKIPSDIVQGLLKLQRQLKQDKKLVRYLHTRPFVAGGYNLKALLQYKNINDIVTHLIIGSTGTLLLLTEVVLKLPKYKNMDLYLIHFSDFDALQKSLDGLLKLGVVSVQYAGRETLDVWDKRYRHKDAVGAIIVGFEKSININKAVTDTLKITTIPERKRAHLWHSRAMALPKLEKKAEKLGLQLPSGIEDTSFDPKYFSRIIKDVKEYAKRKGFRIASYGHLAIGSLHLRPFLKRNKMDIVSKDIFKIVRKYGGTLVGEHNAGLRKSGYLLMESKKMYTFMKKVKKVFDPNNLLNPQVYA